MSQEQCFWHTHHNAELYYFLSGIARVHIEDSIYVANPGDVFLMRPNEPHYFEIVPDTPYERIVINFDPLAFSKFDKSNFISSCFYDRKIGQKNQYRFEDFPNTNFSDSFMKIVKNTPNNETNIFSNLFMVLNEIANVFHSNISMISPSNTSLESDIIRYVNDYIEKPLNIESICQEFFISRSKLTQVFKQSTGMAPWEYITFRRLQKAYELIEKGHLATKIYELCGFDNYSTFYRAFVKQYGKFPSSSKSKKSKTSKGN